LTFLGFFYHFLQLFKVLLKKKKEKLEQCWAQFDFSGPCPGENVCAPAPVVQVCAEVLGVFTNCELVPSLLLRVTYVLQKALRFLFLRRGRSTTTVNAAELR
jgi:hypothetical protein